MKILFILLITFFINTGTFAQELPFIEGQDSFNTTVSQMSDGSFSLSIQNIINNISDLFLKEIKENAHNLILFFVIGVISSVVGLLEFKDKSAKDASFFACYTLCAASALKILLTILEYAKDVVDSMSDFITKLAPILTTLLLTSGKAVSAGAFHPVLASSVFVVTLIVKKCIIPLAVYGSVLSVANNINEQVQISSFCRLITSVSKWILTASFTIFAGVCGIYGFSAPSLDALGAKTAKFAVGTLVPVVGRFLSDTLETVISASTLMKNAVGGAGIVALFSICAIPLIKITVMLFFLRISSALIEPLTDRRISKLLSDMSDIVTVIFGMVITVTVLFIICISIILSATN